MKIYMKQLLCLLLLSFSVISVTLGLNVADNAEPGQFPSVVYITGQNTECAGAIIDQSWILTTAQCVYGQSPQDVMVLAGTNLKENTSGTAFNVSKIIIQDEFTDHTFLVNDIALVKIDGFFEFGDLIKPATITDPPPSNNLITAAGWGDFDTLYYIRMLKVDYDTCNQLLDDAKGSAYPRGPGQFCIAMDLSSTLRDMSGPLFDSPDYLVGLISYTVWSSYNIRLVFVSTVANYYNDWINSVIRNN